MEAFIHQVTSGLATGSIYASMALALVMVYQSTHLVNFAQGEMAVVSTYVAFSLINAGFPYWIAFLLTIAISFIMGVMIERVIIRSSQHGSPLVAIILFIGLLMVLNGMNGWLFTYEIKTFPSPFPSKAITPYVSTHELGTALVTLFVLLLVYLFFRFTATGLAMRAAAHNPESSRLVGIKVGRMLALGWGLAAMVGAVAGMMIAPIVYLEPNMMSGVLLYAIAAALLGGISNPIGAVAGGFIVGVIENLMGAYVIGTELKMAVALLIIVTVLIFKPTGLMGKVYVQKV